MPNNIAELKKMIEDCLPVGPSTDNNLSVTKEPYVRIGIQQGWVPPSNPGIVETCCEPAAAWDEGTACELAWIAFKRYAKGKTGRLYWRQKPQLEVYDDIRYHVYMRLLISNKPVPTTVDRIARAAYEVCRTYNAICMVECGPMWEGLPVEKQAAVIDIVQTIIENPASGASDIHSKWWKATVEKRTKIVSDLDAAGLLKGLMRPFEELSRHDRALDHLTVATVRALLEEQGGS